MSFWLSSLRDRFSASKSETCLWWLSRAEFVAPQTLSFSSRAFLRAGQGYVVLIESVCEVSRFGLQSNET